MATTSQDLDLAAAAKRMGEQPQPVIGHVAPANGADDGGDLERKLQATKDQLERARAAAPRPTDKRADFGEEMEKAKAARAEVAKTETIQLAEPMAKRPAGSKLTINVRKGRLRTPRRYGIYGPEGTGKTTLLASVPDIVIMDIEGGSEMLDVPRFEFRSGERLGYIPRSLKEWRAGIAALLEADHPYKALGLDTADALEPLIVKHICHRDGMPSIEEYGYGKGWTVFVDEFRAVLSDLDRLRERRGMDIVVTAHAHVKPFKNPSGDDYDRYTIKLHDKIAPLWKEWCHELGFIHFDEWAFKASKHAKAKGVGTGKRVIEFDRTPAWDAKARLPLPSRVEVGTMNPWGMFEAAIEQAFNAGPDELIELIADQCERLADDELTAKVTAAIAKANGNVSTLSNYLHELRRREQKAKTDETTENQEQV